MRLRGERIKGKVLSRRVEEQRGRGAGEGGDERMKAKG
jgi:hypothetical protein